MTVSLKARKIININGYSKQVFLLFLKNVNSCKYKRLVSSFIYDIGDFDKYKLEINSLKFFLEIIISIHGSIKM